MVILNITFKTQEGTPDFKWQGGSNGGRNPRRPAPPPPLNPLDQNLTPKKSHSEFPSHNNFQKTEIVAKQVCFYFIRGTTWPGVCGNYYESSDYFQTAQKNTCQNFPTPKKSQNRKFQSKNILQSSLSRQWFCQLKRLESALWMWF